jgi:uncharacterized protein (DUF1501 family)
MGVAPSWLARALASEGRKRKTLVVIFMRGAADGLSIVAPFGDKRYREVRPTLAIAPPNAGSIDLDGTFALNGAMQALKPLWDKRQLAIVEATGSPDPSRSHFDAQDSMESGTPGKIGGNGWLNRALPTVSDGDSGIRAVALTNQVPRTLRGDHEAIVVNNLDQLKLGDQQASSILQAMYAGTPDPALGRAGKNAFDAMRLIQSIQSGPPNQPVRGVIAVAPGQPFGGDLSRSLQQLARLIKAEAGVEAAFAEMGGWDHHSNENQQLVNLLRQLSSAIAGFCQDMGDRMEDLVLVTMSEFGRTVEENGNAGTDHGHGSLMMVVGGPVQGGKVYGTWPGLEKEQLFEGRDLAVTTDYRVVLSELVTRHLGQKDLNSVFPGFQFGEPLGLVRT